MDALTPEQEREAQEVARRTGWDIWDVREVIAVGDGGPGCLVESAEPQPAR